MDARRNEFCFDARPHLCPLLQERILPITVSGFSLAHPANPVVRIFKWTANDSPSPWGEGRVEGGREPFFNGARVVPTRSGCARPDGVGFIQACLTGHALRIGTIRAPGTVALPIPRSAIRSAATFSPSNAEKGIEAERKSLSQIGLPSAHFFISFPSDITL